MTGQDRPAALLVDHLTRVFGQRLIAVTVYDHGGDTRDAPARVHSLVLVSRLSQEDLDGCARLAAEWQRAGIDTPILLPEDEFRRSLDAFPIEYADIVSSHTCVFGRDPFDGVAISTEDMRRACEKQVKSHLLHLREGYIEAQGNPLAIARLVAASAPAFAALLRTTCRVIGRPGPADAPTGAAAAGLDESVVAQVLALTGTTGAPSVDGARLFPGYLMAVERLAHVVDTWRS